MDKTQVKTVQDLLNALNTCPPDALVKGTWEGVVRPISVYKSADGVVLVDADNEYYREHFETGRGSAIDDGGVWRRRE